MRITNLNLLKTKSISEYSTELNNGLEFDFVDSETYISIKNEYVNYIYQNKININRNLEDSIIEIFNSSGNVLSTKPSIKLEGCYSNTNMRFQTKNKVYKAPIFLKRSDYPDYFIVFRHKDKWDDNLTNKKIECVYNFKDSDFLTLVDKFLSNMEDIQNKRSVIPTKYTNLFDVKYFDYAHGTHSKFSTKQNPNFFSLNYNQESSFFLFNKNFGIQPNLFVFNFYFHDTIDSDVNEYNYTGLYLKEKELINFGLDIDFINRNYKTNLKNDFYKIPRHEIGVPDYDLELKSNTNIESSTDIHICRDRYNKLYGVTEIENNVIHLYSNQLNLDNFLGIDLKQKSKTVNIQESLTGSTYSNLKLSLKNNNLSKIFNQGDYIAIKTDFLINGKNGINEWRFISRNNSNNCECFGEREYNSCMKSGKTIHFKSTQIIKEAYSLEIICDNVLNLEEGSYINYTVGTIIDRAQIFKIRTNSILKETRFNLYLPKNLVGSIKQESIFYFDYEEPSYYYSYFDINTSIEKILKNISDNINNHQKYNNLPYRSFISNDELIICCIFEDLYMKPFKFIYNVSRRTDLSNFFINDTIQLEPLSFSDNLNDIFNYGEIEFSGYSTKKNETISILLNREDVSDYTFTENDIVSTKYGLFNFNGYRCFDSYEQYHTNFFIDDKLLEKYFCLILNDGEYASDIFLNTNLVINKKFYPELLKLEKI